MTYRQIRKYNCNELADVTYDDPDKCPCCGRPTVPYFVSAICETETHMSILYVCQSCRSSFLSRFKLSGDYESNSKYAEFIDSVPVSPQKISFSNEINEISPRFCNVFNQASEADQLGLNEICGLGYRKSLEILIKDFCILIHPEDSEEISNEFHMDKLIKKYLSGYAPIQDISKVAFWFGNNEAHYRNDADSANIENLKKYIQAVVGYIQLETIYGAASQRLADRKK